MHGPKCEFVNALLGGFGDGGLGHSMHDLCDSPAKWHMDATPKCRTYGAEIVLETCYRLCCCGALFLNIEQCLFHISDCSVGVPLSDLPGLRGNDLTDRSGRVLNDSNEDILRVVNNL